MKENIKAFIAAASEQVIVSEPTKQHNHHIRTALSVQEVRLRESR
jgi:hypothetical protein